MSFEIITDSASNLTQDLLEQYNIHMISYHVCINDKDFLCYEKDRNYEETGKKFYAAMRNGASMKTSLVNTAQLEEMMLPFLKEGKDIMFVGISSGLSGTVSAARVAAEELSEQFPDRTIQIIDSVGASLGEGLMVIQMAKLRAEGKTLAEATKYYEDNRMFMQHIFTVDDLKYLKKGGRISAAEAAIGTLLSIKPILWASEEGKIESLQKVRTRNKSLSTLVHFVETHITEPENQVVGIAHCDALEEANMVAEEIRKRCPVKDILIRYYDLCTGTHVGPGTIAIFFLGDDRTRPEGKTI